MMKPHKVTEDFEQALCEYTGAKHACVVSSCTMAMRLAFDRTHYLRGPQALTLPSKTYISVANQALQAGHAVAFVDYPWSRCYRVEPTNIIDAAHWFAKDMYERHAGDIICISFHFAKPLGLEQGGAILHDNPEDDVWYREARFDGRRAGVPVAQDGFTMPARYRHHCYINPSTASIGLQRIYGMLYHDMNYADLSKVRWA